MLINLNATQRMPIYPDSDVWGALLGSCNIYCNIELTDDAAESRFKIEPCNPGNYVRLSNINAESGRCVYLTNVIGMMKYKGLEKSGMMKYKGLEKMRGCGWIDIKKKVYQFFVRDVPHRQTEDLCIVEKLGWTHESRTVCTTHTSNCMIDEYNKEDIIGRKNITLAILFVFINTYYCLTVQLTNNFHVMLLLNYIVQI